MKTSELTRDTVLQELQKSRNKKRKIWTASIILDRFGIYRWGEKYENYSRNDRLKANRILKELWVDGILVKKVKPDTRSLFGKEDAYIRSEEAPTNFFVSCPHCHSDVLATKTSQKIHREACIKCGE